MIILKGGVDGFSYFSLISVILFSNQDHPYFNTGFCLNTGNLTSRFDCSEEKWEN